MTVREFMEDAGDRMLSFVVIGYNEGPHLRGCFQAIRSITPIDGEDTEILYVDGGSTDDSLEIARACGVDQILSDGKRRRASENRNVGLRSARGEYIQFIDGDMKIAPDWPGRALAFLKGEVRAAAVCGVIREIRSGAWYDAFGIDWSRPEGTVSYCGGAAMFRRTLLEAVDGFPEELPFGEEPYLCWRLRNELHASIHYLNQWMVDHDLVFRGFGDYWRRFVRVGKTYAAIAVRCARTSDPLWLRESMANLAAASLLLALAAGLLLGPFWLRAGSGAILAGLLMRKTMQTMRRGFSLRVALAYAFHTYFCKLPLAYGELQWLLSWALGRAEGQKAKMRENA